MNYKVFIHSDRRGSRNGIYEFPSEEKCYKWLNTNVFGKKVSPRLRLQLTKDGCVEDADKNVIGYWYALKYEKPRNRFGVQTFALPTIEDQLNGGRYGTFPS